jgi:tRNA (cmo5U34)-methyltransferase
VRNAASMIGSRLPPLGPDEEEAMLKQAGFTHAAVFYVGMAFRGWVTRA